MAVTANYETVMVVSLKNGEENVQKVVEKFKALIENNATLKNVDEWGKRKLAYLINKESEGYYVLFDFESTAEFPCRARPYLQDYRRCNAFNHHQKRRRIIYE